jgi:hypothetical protein
MFEDQVGNEGAVLAARKPYDPRKQMRCGVFLCDGFPNLIPRGFTSTF